LAGAGRLLAIAALAAIQTAWAAESFDVVVVGGTPGGITSAIAAARHGRSVALTEYHPHLGGMSASGLGKSDVETRMAIGGLFNEFITKVRDHYVEIYGADSENVKLSRDGYYFEPHVAEKVFDNMVAAEPSITVLRNHRLEEVIRAGRRVAAVRVRDRKSGGVRELRAKVFVDATYEGDLAAYAGVPFRLGREGRDEFNELHAGVVYQDHDTRRFLPGSTGEGDHRLPAYTFRLCVTEDPANSFRLEQPPPDYDRNRYSGYFDDLASGRLGPPREVKEGRGYYSPHFNTMVRALSFARIPGGKFDINMNPRPLAFPFAELNRGYAEAAWQRREEITEHIRNVTLGLLYFLQNDPEVSAEHRRMANAYHLAKDEFTDSGHFPFQLYIREARRIVGEYTLSERDVTIAQGLQRTPIHADSIAAGEFPIDSFPTRRRELGHDVALEGYILMLDEFTKPYQIPYRIMVPTQVDGLLVPVAASTTHVAFSTIRLEPTWMAMGQAAGTAAHLAIEGNVQPRNIAVGRLQQLLLEDGQVLTYYHDIDPAHPAFKATQFFGTKGLFDDYLLDPDKSVTQGQAERWVKLALGGSPAANEDAVARRDSELTWRLLRVLLRTVSDEYGRALPGDLSPARAAPHDLITRGEFCRILYAWRHRFDTTK
jgi:hypothetical protein